MLEPRIYQLPLIQRIREALFIEKHKSIVACMGTGGGKTPVASFIIAKLASKNIGSWFLVHKTFLLEQASEKLRLCGVRHGIMAAGRTPDPRHNVLVISIGVLWKRIESMKLPEYVFIDEGHHAMSPTWLRIIKYLLDKGCKIIFLTATPERPDGIGMEDVASKIVMGPSNAEMIEWGRNHPGEGLAEYEIFRSPGSGQYASAKHNTKGEFDLNDVGQMMNDRKIMGDAVAEYKSHAMGRRFLTFAPTIAVSERVAEAYRNEGIRCVHLDGSDDKKSIRSALADFEQGQLDGISSVNLFLEGLDVRGVGCIQQLRPTESIVVYLQSLGRGLRSEMGKSSCTILDHVGNVGGWNGPEWVPKHGRPDDPREWSLEGRHKRQSEKPLALWECGRCHTANSAAYAICKSCGEPKKVKLRKEIDVDTSASLERLDLEAIRSAQKKDQASARTVEEMVQKLGYSEGRAAHIEAARKEKAFKRASVRELAEKRGDHSVLREYMQWKPKQLDSYLEGQDEREGSLLQEMRQGYEA
jgi:DNA repair protein RadD